MIDELREYGLSEREAKVYTSSLKSGVSTANQLAKASNERRSTVYEVLESLRTKGLVSASVRGGKRHFKAAEPQRLISLLKEREEKITEILPELTNLTYEQTEEEEVQLYIGKEGVKTLLDDILFSTKEYWVYCNIDLFSHLKYYFPKFILRRIEKGIKARVIIGESAITKDHAKKAQEENREIRFTKQQFPSSTFVYNNKVAIINANKKSISGVLIQSKPIADTQRIIFEMMWGRLKEKQLNH